ncbi:phage tail protein I [Viridibacillus sp. FSL R5-0468]|uniref:phage tail protein I n=1 Tax=Viridibacillus sp. FSL R5-0468 TaxID=2921640 RepID=UPI0030F95764
MSKSINENVFADTLPPSLRKDKFTRALAEAVEIQLKKVFDKALYYANTRDLSDMPERFLDHLAYAKHVDDYDFTWTKKEKINAILKSAELHRIKGTPAAVEKSIEIVFEGGEVNEWFNYGGDPYYFNVEIENEVIEKGDFERARRLIHAAKNTRSHLENIVVKMPEQEITITHQTAAGQYPIPITNTFYTAPTVGKALENIASIEHITVGGTYPILATGAFYTS